MEPIRRIEQAIHYWNQTRKAIDSWEESIGAAEVLLEEKKAEAARVLPSLHDKLAKQASEVVSIMKAVFPGIPIVLAPHKGVENTENVTGCPCAKRPEKGQCVIYDNHDCQQWQGD